jgi:hypothetical protein
MLRNVDGSIDGAAATIKVEDIHGRPPGGASSKVRQRPPPKLKTSMGGPLWGACGKVR